MVRYGALVAKRSATSDKRLANALRVDRTRGTRYRNGSDPHSPFANALALHHRLAKSDVSQAWSLITAGKVVVRKAQIERATLEQLYVRLAELNAIEDMIEATENAKTRNAAVERTPEAHIAAAEADELEADVAVERAAIHRRIAELLRNDPAHSRRS